MNLILGGAAPRSSQVLRDECPSGGVASAGGHAHGVEPQSAGAGVAEDPGHEVLHAADVQGLADLADDVVPVRRVIDEVGPPQICQDRRLKYHIDEDYGILFFFRQYSFVV